MHDQNSYCHSAWNTYLLTSYFPFTEKEATCTANMHVYIHLTHHLVTTRTKVYSSIHICTQQCSISILSQVAT